MISPTGRAAVILRDMFRDVALLILCSCLLLSQFTAHAGPAGGGLKKQGKTNRLEDIIGLFVCGGTEDTYRTHSTSLSEFEIENFSHKVSTQLWVESGTRCQFKNGDPIYNITWSTSTSGENDCATTVERSYLNGGIQRFLRANPTWSGRQCLIILHGMCRP